jgi:hypothetical protein
MSEEEKKKKKKDGEEERSYQGSKVAADFEFAEWVQKQWKRGEKLDRIDVIQYIPKGANKGFGEICDFEIFTSAHNPDMEEAIDMSYRFIGSAQRVVDRIEKKAATFYARAFDKGRAAVSRDGAHGDPVDTFPLFLTPKKLYANLAGGDDLDENGASPQTVTLDYLKEGLRAFARDQDRVDSNNGDLMAMFIQERRDARAHEIVMQQQFRGVLQDWANTVKESTLAMAAMIRDKEGQELQRAITQLKIDGLREGGKFGKNLLAGIIPGFGANGTIKENPNVAQEEKRVVNVITKERSLIDTFFNDCKTAKIDDDLFGKWEKDANGKPQQTKPGIFTIEQFFILGKVHGGYATADALDDLLFDSGKPTAVTMEQLAKAQALEGMKDSIAISLVQLMKLRNEKRKEAREEAAKEKTSTPSSSTSTTQAHEEADDV